MAAMVVVEPELGITPDELAVAWNANSANAGLARAAVVAAPAAAYLPELAEAIIFLGSTVGLGILTNGLYDVLKGVLARKPAPAVETELVELTLPDGTQLTIFRKRERP